MSSETDVTLGSALLVRLATEDDAAAIADVEVSSWQKAYEDLMPATYLAALSRVEKADGWAANLRKHGVLGPKRVLVAVHEDTVVGFVRVGLVPDEGDYVGLVYLLYVAPAYWRRGVGRALMAAAMDELRDLGAREAVLGVLADNASARSFYETLGWHQEAKTSTENYGGATLEAVHYKRSVAT